VLGTSVAGASFQLVDLAFVSRLGEDATTAVVVTNQSLRQAFFMIVMGASFGAQGLIARCVGEGRGDAADHAAGQLVVLGLALACVAALVGVLAPRPLLAALNVSESVLQVGVPYVRSVFALSAGLVFVLFTSAILNGAGDATTPFLVAILQTPLALFAEWCFIFGNLGAPRLGILGVAVGIAVGQLGAIVLCARVLFRGTSRVHLRLHHLVPDPPLLRRLVALSWPPAVQLLAGFLVTVFFIRLVGDFGATAQTAYSIGLRLGMVGPMLAFPIAGACATLVGHNLGAGQVPRAWRALGVGLAAHATLLWSLAVLLYLFRVPIVTAFSDDPEVVRIGSELLAYQAGSFALFAFYFVFLRTLQGAGDVRVPMWISLGNALCVTLPLGVWLSGARGMGPTGIFLASLVGSVTVTLATGAWLGTGRWARHRASPGPPAGQGADAR
jgi:putative MATE family efflux protein